MLVCGAELRNHRASTVLRRILVSLGVALAGAAVFATAWVLFHARDRHAGYSLDLRVAPGPPAPLRVGFAAVRVTPDVPDRWTDENGNARFDEGEPFEDGNGNGRFDPVWLAGFHHGRPAVGVHDDLWARSMAISDGRTTLVLTAIDSIGIAHDQVVEIRSRVPEDLVDYALVASTHTHEAPDVVGLWGPSPLRSGADPAYRERVIDGAARAIREAASALRPARLRFAEVPEAAAGLVTDSRRPIVLDPGVRVIQAVDPDSGASRGLFVVWGNHPETTWSDNLLVSSDFPHFVREALEAELGGTVVYASGAIGGLMTTLPGFAVRDPDTGAVHTAPSFEKASAQGRALARIVVDALRDGEVVELRHGSLAVRARSLPIPLDNPPLFLLASLGVVQRGFVEWGALRTEIAAIRLGPASFLAVPGEIYPELVNGGIESPPGRDFEDAPPEEPPLRALMPGRFRFVIGLANDAIGYIVPKSEWDDEPPWLYGEEEETYGEVVSLGPETAPSLHAAMAALLADLRSGQGR